MKTNLIIFSVLAILFTPAFSFSAVPPLTFLTIIVNTQGKDAAFHYDLNTRSIDIQTEGLSGSEFIVFTPSGGSYSLTQVTTPVLRLKAFFAQAATQIKFFYTSQMALFLRQNTEKALSAHLTTLKSRPKTLF